LILIVMGMFMDWQGGASQFPEMIRRSWVWWERMWITRRSFAPEMWAKEGALRGSFSRSFWAGMATG
jgi:hypothetical protein